MTVVQKISFFPISQSIFKLESWNFDMLEIWSIVIFFILHKRFGTKVRTEPRLVRTWYRTWTFSTNLEKRFGTNPKVRWYTNFWRFWAHFRMQWNIHTDLKKPKFLQICGITAEGHAILMSRHFRKIWDYFSLEPI